MYPHGQPNPTPTVKPPPKPTLTPSPTGTPVPPRTTAAPSRVPRPRTAPATPTTPPNRPISQAAMLRGLEGLTGLGASNYRTMMEYGVSKGYLPGQITPAEFPLLPTLQPSTLQALNIPQNYQLTEAGLIRIPTTTLPEIGKSSPSAGGGGGGGGWDGARRGAIALGLINWRI